MNIREKMHGFRKTAVYPIPELDATLYEMRYEKNGATLYILDREDENKTFAITFKTIPEDSTGVFHIIEHSVLCGSEKYRVKEPFVELLKGSLQTFLNALTFPDKTMYPLSTRNDKDFLNLINVYMDAVLHPAILTNPNIFRQEGWHYELDAEGKLTRNGVVYNEMKGAYSSPDEVMGRGLEEMIYRDTCYRHDSGGDPDVIPELTYEKFLAAHKKYYHPSNAQIFLDGSMDIDAVLTLLDGYLSEYDEGEPVGDIVDQTSCPDTRREIEYEIAPTDSEKDKTRVALGMLSVGFDENTESVALGAIFDAVASTNESVLKKEILDSGLCDDFMIYDRGETKRHMIIASFTNVRDGKEDELIDLFYSSVRKICETGIDREQLEASLNSMEFKLREKDFGSMPKGIIYAISLLSSTLYGGDPTQELTFDDVFRTLRADMDTDRYERILEKYVLNNADRTTLIMHPSSTLGERRAKRDADALALVKDSFTEEELLRTREIQREFEKWQQTPDTPEGLATLPYLTIDDIPKKAEHLPLKVYKEGCTDVLYHDVNTEGITYVTLYFDITDIDAEDVTYLKLALTLLKEVPTENYEVSELQKKIKRDLGSLNFSLSPCDKDGECKIYLQVGASTLNVKKAELAKLIKEVLLTSNYAKKETILNILRQSKLTLEEYFTESGHAAALGRVRSTLSAVGAVEEYASGYECYKMLKDLLENFDEKYEDTVRRMTALVGRAVTKDRLTVSLTGERDDALVREICASIPDGDGGAAVCRISPLNVKSEGIVIPAQVAYAAMADSLRRGGEENVGTYYVVRSILSYEYLWNAVRVRGGAYGAGFTYDPRTTDIGFYSYRDPSPARTIDCYGKAAQALREIVASGRDLTQFIIGAIGELSPILTPAMIGRASDKRYLSGVSEEAANKRRAEALSTDGGKLLAVADALERMTDDAPVCIVGGEDKLAECPFLLKINTL